MKTRKIIFTMLITVLLSGSAFANFVSARVKVTGITCSMCSNSVHKALSSLSFIDKIDVNLENAEFTLTFKASEKVVMDLIKEKIEGAGFSVGEIIAAFKFDNLHVKKDFHYEFENNVYHFVNVKDQDLNNLVAIRFVDKGMTSQKEYKKYVGLTTYSCIKTGKSADCCNTASKKRVYHITL